MSADLPYQCQTPVVLILFKRPETTARVFQAIRAARPPRLLVVADGPRSRGERGSCDQARAVVDAVDWPCQVHRNFSEVNLGCRRRVAGGLDWAFSLVEEAIILEDDCLPHPSFFRYCDELLARYRDQDRVRMIAGTNLGAAPLGGQASYAFSRYPLVWGWASWRRAWRDYDGELRGWPAFKAAGGLERLLGDPVVAAYWSDIFERLREEGRPDTWDYQLVFTSFVRDGLVTVPSVNLVSNIGIGAGATTTLEDTLGLSNLPLHDIGELLHPVDVAWDAEADRRLFERGFGGERVRRWYAKEQTVHRRLKRRWDRLRRAVGLK